MRPNHPSRTLLATIGLAAVFALLPTAVQAGDRVELTPTVGFRTNPIAYPSLIFCIDLLDGPCQEQISAEDDVALGLVIDIPLTDRWMLEVRIDRQTSDSRFGFTPIFLTIATDDIDITTLTVGGLYGWRVGATEPFVAVGAGVATVDPGPLAFPPFGLDGEHLALSLSGGVKLFPERRLGLRVEARGLWIDVPSGIDGGVAVETAAGVIVRF